MAHGDRVSRPPSRPAFAVILVAAIASSAAGDVWSPGATQEPWPLIARVQGAAELVPSDWAGALSHPDPLVRASAAYRVGRAGVSAQASALRPLWGDGAEDVRNAALWAIAQMDVPLEREWLEPALLDRPSLDVGPALIRRGVPAALAHYASVLDRARWLNGVRIQDIRPSVYHAGAALSRAAVSMEDSEWDAGEIAFLKVRLDSTAGMYPAEVRLSGTLRALDPYIPPGDRAASEDRRKAQALAVRFADATDPQVLKMQPGSTVTAEVSFPLDGLEPGPYEVSVLQGANPVFIRVRRSVENEERARQASARLDSAEARQVVARLRITPAATALRQRFREHVQAYGFGFNAYETALVLARLQDGASVDAVLEAALSHGEVVDPWDGMAVGLDSPLLSGYGDRVGPYLDRVAESWKVAAGDHRRRWLLEALADPRRTPGTRADRARLEIIAEWLPTFGVAAPWGHPERSEHAVVRAALAGALYGHPREVAEALAVSRSRAELSRLLDELCAGRPWAAQANLLRHLAAALAGRAEVEDDVRAMVAFAAEQRGVTLDAGSVRYGTAGVAETQIGLVAHRSYVPEQATDAVLARARALLARSPSPSLAVRIADLELLRGHYASALSVVPAADAFAGDASHAAWAALIRGKAHAALGQLDKAREHLRAVSSPASHGGQEQARAVLNRIESLDVAPPIAVRLFPSERRLIVPIRAPVGSELFVVTHRQELRRLDPRGTDSFSAFVPMEVHAMAAVSPTAVVLASSNGRLMRLDHGAAAPTWTASLGEPAAGHPDPVMVANERVVVARDVRKRAHAFDASTGAPLWQRPADGVALTAGTDGDVLIAAATLQRVAARDGRPRWSRLTGHDTQLHAVGSEVAVISNGPVVAMVRLADGTLWSLDLRPLVPGGYLESNTVQAAVVGEGRRVLVAAWGQLFVLAAADGQLLATLRFAAPADVITMGERASSRLITAPGGRAWWVVHYYGTRRGKSGWRNTVKLVNGDGVVVTRSDDAAGDVAALGDGSLLREREWGTELLEVPAGAPK